MFSPNIEQAVNYSSLPPSLMPSRGSSEGRRDTAKHCCGKLMWRLINCFRSQEQGQIRPRYAYYQFQGHLLAAAAESHLLLLQSSSVLLQHSAPSYAWYL